MSADWLKVTDKGNESGEIYIYGPITDEKWTEEEVTPFWFKDQIAKLSKIKNINLYINSPGGGVFAGLTIYNIIKRLSANVTAYIDGLAASIASVIPMAAAKIVMPKNALMMIHNPIGIAVGTAEDMRNEADLLDRAKLAIRSTYENKTKKAEKIISDMMNAQTWMTGEEAVTNGFADILDEQKDMKAYLDGEKFTINGLNVDLSNFKTFPKNRFNSNDDPQDPYPNEHAARVREPGDFKPDSFRRKNISDGVDIIIGKLKSGEDSMVTQAYRFDAQKFTVDEAKKWLKDHDIKYISFEPASGESNRMKNLNHRKELLL